ncbi:hypothetical protein BDW59DRAFT_155411 [Aspergillus cavernicola]|uniref:Epidermal growth factor receptor-like transmembrane-juxtamembrane segment domain-containing protein n=1 Tax=Aspergillus cavernicola TaxID=176166 RepID=A0ABR4H995_9EURO
MGDTDYGPPAGFAIRRNGTCTAKEEECSHPWGNWYNCCPESTHCSDNNTCCPTTAGCSAYIEEDPHCANNATWDLYIDNNNYFCCLSTSTGFVASNLMYNGSSTTGVGCADGLPEGEYNNALIPVARGNASESTVTSASATPSATNTHTPSPTASDTAPTSSSNAGAIAGGVVGGCAGVALIIALVWFLMRRRKQQALQAGPMSPDASTPGQEYKGVYGGELDNNPARVELYGNPNMLPHELPTNASQ